MKYLRKKANSFNDMVKQIKQETPMKVWTF